MIFFFLLKYFSHISPVIAIHVFSIWIITKIQLAGEICGNNFKMNWTLRRFKPKENKLVQSFAKTLKQNSMLSFELSDSCHTTETRKNDLYKVTFCRTEWFKKNLLYQEFKICLTWNNEPILITIVNFVNGEFYGSGQQG